MKTRLMLICTFLLVQWAQAQQLVIDNQGHAGIVNDIFFLEGGKYLLSTSDDKTIKVWDVAGASLYKTYRFYQESGANGKIYSSALSKDERYLFLGGFFDKKGGDPGKIGELRILNLYNEQLIQSIPAHQNVILDMKISKDGKRLVTSSADHTIKIWKISDIGSNSRPELITTIEAPILPNCIAINPSGTMIVAGDAQGFLRTWDISNLNKIETDRSKIHTDEIRALAFSSTGDNLYSCGDDGQLIKWTGNGKFMGAIATLPGPAGAINLSPDDQYLTVMGRAGLTYDLSTETAISSFSLHTNSVSAITSAPFGSFGGQQGDYLASAGGDDKNILVWERTSGKLVRNLVGNGHSVYAVGTAGLKIGLGQSNPTGNLDDTKIEKAFDLKSLNLNLSEVDQMDFSRSDLNGNGLLLTKESFSSFGIGGNIVSLDETKDGNVRSFSYVQNNQGIVVGSSFTLKKFSPSGELLGSYKGHEGETWAVCEMKSEELLVSGNGDQTIKIWNINTGENLLTLFVSTDNEWVIWTPQGFYEASAGGEKYIGWHINKGRKRLSEFHDVSAFSDHYHRRDVIKRVLELKSFEAVAREMSLSLKPEEEVVPPEVRWDYPIVKNSIVKGNSTKLSFTITSKYPIKKLKLLANGRPVVNKKGLNISGGYNPESIDLDLTVPKGSEDSYEISLYVMDEKSKITGTDKKITFQTPEMPEELLEEKVVATAQPAPVYKAPTNRDSRSRLTLDPVNDQHHSTKNLYVVSIGVSQFENPTYNLNYAEADASSISDMWTSQKGKMYDKVTNIKITDTNATKEKILSTFKQLGEYTTVDDLVVIFMASHGMNVKNKFYFLPHDGSGSSPKSTCVDWKDFSDMIGDIPAKTLLFIDTCHSGQLGSNIGQNAQDNTEAVRKMSSKEYGVIVMAAATGYEYSLEHADWGHGAFTLSILEGIGGGKADVNGDGTIYLRELDYYLAERVRELTGGRQHPTTQKPSSISRLPLASSK